MNRKSYSEPIYRMIRAYLVQQGFEHTADETTGRLEVTIRDEAMRPLSTINLSVGFGSFDCTTGVGLELPDIRWDEAMYFINAYNARLHAGSLRVRFPNRELYYHISCDCGTGTPSKDLIHEIVETARTLWPKIGPRLQSVIARSGLMERALEGIEGYEDFVGFGSETRTYDPGLTAQDPGEESKSRRRNDSGLA